MCSTAVAYLKLFFGGGGGLKGVGIVLKNKYKLIYFKF